MVKEEPKQPTIKPVSFLGLFKYSDGFDKFLMIFGSLTAMGGGAAMPFFMIFFSEISTIFIEENRAEAEAKGREVAVKFFILGGATWILSKFEIIF